MAAMCAGCSANPAWLAFLASSLCGGLYLTVEMNFLMLYLSVSGSGRVALWGSPLVVSTLGELPVWALAPYLLRRLGRRERSRWRFSGAVQRMAFLVVTMPWMILPVLLHGLSHSLRPGRPASRTWHRSKDSA